MKSIGVHAYGGGDGGSNFACPICPDVLNPFTNVVNDQTPKILYRENGIDYVPVSLPPTMTYTRDHYSGQTLFLKRSRGWLYRSRNEMTTVMGFSGRRSIKTRSRNVLLLLWGS